MFLIVDPKAKERPLWQILAWLIFCALFFKVGLTMHFRVKK